MRYHLASHYLKVGATRRAKPHFEFVVNNLKPGNVQERKLLALVTLHLGRNHQAVKLLRKLGFEPESGAHELRDYLALLVQMSALRKSRFCG